MRVREQRDLSRSLYFLADILAIAAAYFVAFYLRFHCEVAVRFFALLNRFLEVRDSAEVGPELEAFYLDSAPRIILILIATVCVLYALRDLYAGWRFIGRRARTWNLIVGNALALALFYAYFYLSRNVFHPRSFFATVMALNVLFGLGLRALADRLLHLSRRRFGLGRCRALLLGDGPAASYLSHLIGALHPYGIEIADRIPHTGDRPFEQMLADIDAAARRQPVEMIIAADERFSVPQIMSLLETADRLDASVKVLSDKLDVLMHRAHLPVDLIHGLPLVHFEAPSISGRFDGLRRATSFAVALAGLVLALPLMAVIALLVALTSPGGVFFVQERIGANRRPFRMWKFRTMHSQAEELQAEVEELNESGPGRFKVRRDPRVTPVGRFLRRFSLDELPQLMNVLRGEMLIVGPRPLPRRDFEHYYEDWHYGRHTGLPGLTCLWQVSGRSEIGFHDMCLLDVYYLRNRNWVLDLKIVLRTIWAVLFAKGAY